MQCCQRKICDSKTLESEKMGEQCPPPSTTITPTFKPLFAVTKYTAPGPSLLEIVPVPEIKVTILNSRADLIDLC